MTYEEARAELAASLDGGRSSVSLDALRTLLAGPPEPTEEDVAECIQKSHAFFHRGSAQAEARARLSLAQAIQQLYRSRRHG